MGEDKGKQDKPKIIVDDDWKQQAQAEKERLSKEVETGKAAAASGAAAGPAGAAGEPHGEEHELPPASLGLLINMLAAQAMYAMGGMQDPQTKKRYVDLELAKHHIELLAVLEEKTKGNATDDEKKLLDQALYQTRMQFVQIAQMLSQG